MAESPPTILKKLADLALSLTAANSSGISLADKRGDEDIFRWHATAGEFSRYAGGTMPRYFSPCGTVLDMKQSLLMRDPVRYYPHIAKLHLPVREVLLVPFSRGDVLIGNCATRESISAARSKVRSKELRRQQRRRLIRSP